MSLTVSVIIPTYNRARFLPDAIGSVLRQTCPVHEIIVVDDGSTDGTRDVVEKIPGPIRYLYQPNAGPAAARNRGLREANGTWIALQDSDDLWVPEKIRIQTEFLTLHPQLDFAFGHLSNFTVDAEKPGEPEILDRKVFACLLANAADLKDFFRQLLISNPVPTPAVMFRRDCLRQVGYFDESLDCCEDYEFWLRFAWHCRCGFIDAVLVKRRIHDSNLVNDFAVRCERHLHVLGQVPIKYPEMTDQVRRTLRRAIAQKRYNLASWYQKQGDPRRAFMHYQQIRPLDLLPNLRVLVAFCVKFLLIRRPIRIPR
jgi:glycosyltransferase involved in cell wall biosynthesis